MAKKPVDPKRSAAAKRGWENRRRREKREARFRRSLAARKGWAARRVKAAERLPESQRVAALLGEISQLNQIVEKQKQEIEILRIRSEKRKEKVERLKHIIKRIKKPYAIELQEAVKRDRDAADRGVYERVEELRGMGWGVFQSLYEVWEEINFIEGYEDIADVREAWFDEYLQKTG